VPNPTWSAPSRRHLPIILIRGFGGLDVEDEKALAYQGFNDGSVYPHKRGENYIYEGLILRLLKHRRRYYDATNVVGYFANPVTNAQPIPGELAELDANFFSGHKVVIDAGMALRLLQSEGDPFCSVWVFRYYDLNDRTFGIYGEALVRLIQFIQALLRLRGRADANHRDTPLKVNVIAHSMGGLIVREAIQRAYPKLTGRADAADQAINKVVTLGTPHKGISFQLIRQLRWLGIEAEEELEHFNPTTQSKPGNEAAWVNFHKHFPLERLLTVVGTDYRSYGVRSSTWANRLFAIGGEYGPNYNRSDGLVKQTAAQIDGAPRTFVHKCHGGFDSLITSRETYEISTRFFNGNIRARLRLIAGKIKRGFDWMGKSEFFFGVSIKPRRVDFELFHQSKEAENCYGPFHTDDLSDGDPAFGWADQRRLIWEGYLDVDFEKQRDLVLRADFYVGERDLFGIGFSDNVVFYKQYYVRAIFKDGLKLFLYTGEEFAGEETDESIKPPLAYRDGGWQFEAVGTGFEGTLQIELDWVPEDGRPVALEPGGAAAKILPV
jgi:hypothetical protein